MFPWTTTPVPTSITRASQAMSMNTDDHLITLSMKVEDPDIDILDENIECGDSNDGLDGGENSY